MKVPKKEMWRPYVIYGAVLSQLPLVDPIYCTFRFLGRWADTTFLPICRHADIGLCRCCRLWKDDTDNGEAENLSICKISGTNYQYQPIPSKGTTIKVRT